MMTLNEFYEKYNLNHTYFASMAHVGVSTLKKYEKKEPIRSYALDRIEKAMNTIIEHDLVRPKYDRSSPIGYWRYWNGMKYNVMIENYERQFQKLLEEG